MLSIAVPSSSCEEAELLVLALKMYTYSRTKIEHESSVAERRFNVETNVERRSSCSLHAACHVSERCGLGCF